MSHTWKYCLFVCFKLLVHFAAAAIWMRASHKMNAIANIIYVEIMNSIQTLRQHHPHFALAMCDKTKCKTSRINGKYCLCYYQITTNFSRSPRTRQTWNKIDLKAFCALYRISRMINMDLHILWTRNWTSHSKKTQINVNTNCYYFNINPIIESKTNEIIIGI